MDRAVPPAALTIVLLVALVLAVAALAARSKCGGSTCRGTKGPDRISGSPKADRIKALAIPANEQNLDRLEARLAQMA